MDEPLPDPIPAATLIVLRDAADGGAPELLMVERAAAMAFAAGALVFPGGRVDEGDRAMARGGADPDEAAARLAAIRETIEEAGLAIAVEPAPTPSATSAMRRSLHAGDGLAAALAIARARATIGALAPFARWRPAHRHSRLYDTRFYLARLPAGAPEASVDATENVRLFWATAAAVLAECDAGRATVIFPTRRNLERLKRFASIDEAFADARAYPADVITPWIETRGGVPHLCIPEGLGYPITAEPMETVRRG